MKIASWNIGEDERNIDGHLTEESYIEIADVIKNMNIDVICLQEAITYSKKIPNIAKYISNNTDLKYIIDYELSDSHINIGAKMGIVICSKYRISNVEKYLLNNPNFVYNVSDSTTYHSHDKGFIICDINDTKIITGHCLPFHVFKKSQLDYLYIFKEFDNKLTEEYKRNNRIILCGDMNYEDINSLFPQFMNKAKNYINEPTRNDKQIDHIVVSNEIVVESSQVSDGVFDHKMCMIEIK